MEKTLKAPNYAAKTGEAVVKKGAVAGLTEAETTSLVGDNKMALEKILAMLSVVAATAAEAESALSDYIVCTV